MFDVKINKYYGGDSMFNLVSNYKPSGDQPEAIKSLVDGINSNKKDSSIKDRKSVV